MHARCFRGPEQRAEVLRVLERVEDENERRFLSFDRPGKNVVEAGELATVGYQRDPLVAVEARQRGQRSALDLDNRDAQVRGMENELL